MPEDPCLLEAYVSDVLQEADPAEMPEVALVLDLPPAGQCGSGQRPAKRCSGHKPGAGSMNFPGGRRLRGSTGSSWQANWPLRSVACAVRAPTRTAIGARIIAGQCARYYSNPRAFTGPPCYLLIFLEE
jgi:hypothetical protein